MSSWHSFLSFRCCSPPASGGWSCISVSNHLQNHHNLTGTNSYLLLQWILLASRGRTRSSPVFYEGENIWTVTAVGRLHFTHLHSKPQWSSTHLSWPFKAQQPRFHHIQSSLMLFTAIKCMKSSAKCLMTINALSGATLMLLLAQRAGYKLCVGRPHGSDIRNNNSSFLLNPARSWRLRIIRDSAALLYLV